MFIKNPEDIQQLDVSNGDLHPILSILNIGIVITDDKGVITFYNSVHAEIDGLRPADVIGRKICDFTEVDENSSLIMRCLRTSRPVIECPVLYKNRNGKIVDSINSVFPLVKNGKVVGVISFVTDYQVVDSTPESDRIKTAQLSFAGDTDFTLDDIIGKSVSMLDAISRTRMAAQTDSPVLLSGETGTGKELFAQAIHNLSKRKKARYIAVNCAAIPENLLEGILFGTSRGAFTGALDKPGLFERAHGGTIFLDEINSMSQEMQPKLLRAIQEKKICRVGSHKEMRLNVKIISSLNKDIKQTFLSGEVRRDLLYRLSVVRIALPPLRERKGDIVLLSDHFLAKHSAIMHKNVSGISTEVMDLFEHHNWPGNVRELEHVIEGALNMIGRDRTLEKWHLNSNIDLEMQKPIPRATAASLESSPPLQGRLYSGQPDDKANERSDQVGREGEGTEKQQILEALYDTDGNISDAAMLMGVSRKTLYRKLKSCNIVIPPKKTSTLDRREIVEKLYQYGGNVTHTAKALGISRQLLAYKLKKMKIERP